MIRQYYWQDLQLSWVFFKTQSIGSLGAKIAAHNCNVSELCLQVTILHSIVSWPYSFTFGNPCCSCFRFIFKLLPLRLWWVLFDDNRILSRRIFIMSVVRLSWKLWNILNFSFGLFLHSLSLWPLSSQRMHRSILFLSRFLHSYFQWPVPKHVYQLLISFLYSSLLPPGSCRHNLRVSLRKHFVVQSSRSGLVFLLLTRVFSLYIGSFFRDPFMTSLNLSHSPSSAIIKRIPPVLVFPKRSYC